MRIPTVSPDSPEDSEGRHRRGIERVYVASHISDCGMSRVSFLGPEIGNVRLETTSFCAPASEAMDEHKPNQGARRGRESSQPQVSP